ncbi:MAG: hypothetical protein K2P81_07355 [Bacteriovoracaceae bacterium]|nr:hypothetical protein [Bacteriovoracaceae bacterium]
MVGLFQLSLFVFGLLLIEGCAQIEADPHFWPGARHRLLKVAPTEVTLNTLSKPTLYPHPPSLTKSEWFLIKKSSFAERTYLLVLKDQEGKPMDNQVAPEMILNGDANLLSVVKVAPASWNVKLEFPIEQSITKIGFKFGGHRVENFRQINFQTHELDLIQSMAYSNKSRVRSDGKDAWIIYVDLKDVKGYSIYSTDEFKITLHVNDPDAIVEGPISGATGPFFRVKSLKAKKLKYFVTADSEIIAGTESAEFFDPPSRLPAEENEKCLSELSQASGMKIPSHLELEETYSVLAEELLRRYEEKRDLSPSHLKRNLDLLSSEACSSKSVWDLAREEAGRKLRNIHRRLSR